MSICKQKQQVEKLKTEAFVVKKVPKFLDNKKLQNKGKSEEVRNPIVETDTKFVTF